jgi:hypothetical protein
MGTSGNEAIQIYPREHVKSNKSPLLAVVCYDHRKIIVKDDGKIEIASQVKMNLNEELIRLGYSKNCLSKSNPVPVPAGLRSTPYSTWKPCKLPQNDHFWGIAQWVNMDGESKYKILIISHFSYIK